MALLRGHTGVKLKDDGVDGDADRTVIPIIGDSRESFMTISSGRGVGDWPVKLQYEVEPGPEDDAMPIWLTPSLVQDAARRALELDLQWTAFGLKGDGPVLQRIDLLRVEVPICVGDVETVSDGAVIGTEMGTAGEEACRVIEWRQLAVNERQREESHRAFFVRFENPIGSDSTIQGRIDLSFAGAMSGLKGVDLFSALGYSRSDERKAVIRTSVTADFKLSLAGLRYQDARVIPDRKIDADKGRQETLTFEGVVPDHTTVVALTNAVSEQGFYVKRVIENPPRTGGRAEVINRYWDIGGQHFRVSTHRLPPSPDRG